MIFKEPEVYFFITYYADICMNKQNLKYFYKIVKMAVREGVKKKIVEFSTKMGGWGQQWTDFPLFFIYFFFLNMGILRHTYFFQFLVGGPFSAWILVRRVCQTFKAL